MQIVTVTHSDFSKSNKPRVYFDGKNDWKDAYYCGKTEVPQVGARIEVNTSSAPAPGGNGVLWFLNSWKLAADQPVHRPAATTQQAASYTAPQTFPMAQATQADVMRFVSNVVGSAIAACVLKEPKDVASWASAALMAANGVVAGKIEVKPFNDNLPKF